MCWADGITDLIMEGGALHAGRAKEEKCSKVQFA